MKQMVKYQTHADTINTSPNIIQLPYAHREYSHGCFGLTTTPTTPRLTRHDANTNRSFSRLVLRLSLGLLIELGLVVLSLLGSEGVSSNDR